MTKQEPCNGKARKCISAIALLLIASAVFFSLSRKVYAQSADATLQNATNLIAQVDRFFGSTLSEMKHFGATH